jgi:hypothetical protein
MEKDGNSQLKYLTTKIEPKKTREIHRWKMGIELTKDSFLEEFVVVKKWMFN